MRRGGRVFSGRESTPDYMGEKNGGGLFRGLALVASLGVNLVATTFAGLAIGYYLDEYLSTGPWLTVIFLVLGIVSGFRQMYVVWKRYGGLRS